MCSKSQEQLNVKTCTSLTIYSQNFNLTKSPKLQYIFQGWVWSSSSRVLLLWVGPWHYFQKRKRKKHMSGFWTIQNLRQTTIFWSKTVWSSYLGPTQFLQLRFKGFISCMVLCDWLMGFLLLLNCKHVTERSGVE